MEKRTSVHRVNTHWQWHRYERKLTLSQHGVLVHTWSCCTVRRGIVQPKKHPSELFTDDLRKNAFNLI